jgi:hypothetical protein
MLDRATALKAAMPRMLMNGAPTRDEQGRQILDGMTAKTWKKDRERMLALLAGAPWISR